MATIIDVKEIKRKLESTKCPTHNQAPEVIIQGEGFNFKCCCESFQKSLLEKVEQQMGNQAEAYIEKQFKNIFKGFK